MEKISKVMKVAVMQGSFLSMDFAGNLRIIMKALEAAAKEQASLIICPELCIPGADCEDHFFEKDTETHSWEILAKIMGSGLTDKMLCGFGMPVNFNNVLYDCMVYCYNRKIALIRPKICLRDTGYSRQGRWFAAWTAATYTCDYYLPTCIKKCASQEVARFGGGLIRTNDGVVLMPQIDVELTGPSSGYECLCGAEVIINSSASYHELSRYERGAKFMQFYSMQQKCVFLCANPLGCDGTRLYYEGGSMIWSNGSLIAQAPRFSLDEFNLAFANIDIEEIRAVRATDSVWKVQATQCEPALEIIDIELDIMNHLITVQKPTAPLVEGIKPLPIHEELALCSGNWMWDYLRHTGSSGFFIPLSGGADSSSCATIIALLAERLYDECKKGNQLVLAEVKRVAEDKAFVPSSGKDILAKILYTAYMGTSNSSMETRGRAKKLAETMGFTHIDGTIDEAVEGLKKTLHQMTGFTPKFEAMGGSKSEDIALQNVQARSRLIIAYFVAQVLPTIAKRSGFFFVVATGNGDECIRGYFTKYDCSSGDLDPIGSWTKQLVNAFLDGWASKYPTLAEVRTATPSAELKPLEGNKQLQTDEADMGFTYAELAVMGKIRKVDKCGPVSMFEKLAVVWSELSPDVLADKVKRFFKFYAYNRHKMASLPPGLHSTAGNCDDNRYDQRQILYNSKWEHQFQCLDELVKSYKSH